jgi:hypothetical protein
VKRDSLVRQIVRHFKPVFYDSGFLEEDNRPVRLFAFQEPLHLGGFVLDEVVAIAADGVVTDAYGHAMATTLWSAIPVEDLQLLSQLKPTSAQ